MEAIEVPQQIGPFDDDVLVGTDGQAEPSELQGLRPRKLPDPAVGENAGRDPLHPQLRSPSAPHQIEKELKMAFPERDEGAGTGVDEDLGIDD